jgi:hypothetical protein
VSELLSTGVYSSPPVMGSPRMVESMQERGGLKKNVLYNRTRRVRYQWKAIVPCFQYYLFAGWFDVFFFFFPFFLLDPVKEFSGNTFLLILPLVHIVAYTFWPLHIYIL